MRTLTVTKAVATVAADAKSRIYGAANPALTAVVTGQVADGDTLDYTPGDDGGTAVAASAATRSTVTLGIQPELQRDQDQRALTVNKARGDGDGRREEQVLRRGQPGADGGGDRARWRAGTRSTTAWRRRR